jgi:hypothetical protein
VAGTITINPIVASVVASTLVSERIHANVLAGVLAVGVGIWIASRTHVGTWPQECK